jgi:hypothetical protein
LVPLSNSAVIIACLFRSFTVTKDGVRRRNRNVQGSLIEKDDTGMPRVIAVNHRCDSTTFSDMLATVSPRKYTMPNITTLNSMDRISIYSGYHQLQDNARDSYNCSPAFVDPFADYENQFQPSDASVTTYLHQEPMSYLAATENEFPPASGSFKYSAGVGLTSYAANHERSPTSRLFTHKKSASDSVAATERRPTLFNIFAARGLVLPGRRKSTTDSLDGTNSLDQFSTSSAKTSRPSSRAATSTGKRKSITDSLEELGLLDDQPVKSAAPSPKWNSGGYPTDQHVTVGHTSGNRPTVALDIRQSYSMNKRKSAGQTSTIKRKPVDRRHSSFAQLPGVTQQSLPADGMSAGAKLNGYMPELLGPTRTNLIEPVRQCLAKKVVHINPQHRASSCVKIEHTADEMLIDIDSLREVSSLMDQNGLQLNVDEHSLTIGRDLLAHSFPDFNLWQNTPDAGFNGTLTEEEKQWLKVESHYPEQEAVSHYPTFPAPRQKEKEKRATHIPTDGEDFD